MAFDLPRTCSGARELYPGAEWCTRLRLRALVGVVNLAIREIERNVPDITALFPAEARTAPRENKAILIGTAVRQE